MGVKAIKELLIFTVLGLFFVSSLYAGMIVIRGPSGEQYQINEKFKVKNGVRITQIRWPDNKVDTIHISGCDGRSARTLTRYSRSGRDRFETLPWSPGGINLIDRVSISVCAISR